MRVMRWWSLESWAGGYACHGLVVMGVMGWWSCVPRAGGHGVPWAGGHGVGGHGGRGLVVMGVVMGAMGCWSWGVMGWWLLGHGGIIVHRPTCEA